MSRKLQNRVHVEVEPIKHEVMWKWGHCASNRDSVSSNQPTTKKVLLLERVDCICKLQIVILNFFWSKTSGPVRLWEFGPHLYGNFSVAAQMVRLLEVVRLERWSSYRGFTVDGLRFNQFIVHFHMYCGTAEYCLIRWIKSRIASSKCNWVH